MGEFRQERSGDVGRSRFVDKLNLCSIQLAVWILAIVILHEHLDDGRHVLLRGPLFGKFYFQSQLPVEMQINLHILIGVVTAEWSEAGFSGHAATTPGSTFMLTTCY